MFTIFTIPKPFVGHIDIIQRNAIQSWQQLHPSVEILLFGHDQGVAEFAAEFGFNHIPEVKLNSYGTPLLNDVFSKAQEQASFPILCYVNADIIFTQDFCQTVKKATQYIDHFLLVGRRWDIEQTEPIDMSPQWEEALRSLVLLDGKLHDVYAIDYFVFSKGVIDDMPPFAVGRAGWDNWVIYDVRTKGLPVIDATDNIMCIHQNHDYSHLAGGQAEAYKGKEANENRAFAGNDSYFNINDATHILTGKGLEPNLKKDFLWQRLNRQKTLSRFKDESTLRFVFFKCLIWVWILLFRCFPFEWVRNLLYSWMTWNESQPPHNADPNQPSR